MASASPPLLTAAKSRTSLLTAQHCTGHVHLILGSNPLAAARASSSLAAGAKPILISPVPSSSSSPDQPQHQQLHYSLESLIASGSLTHLSRPFSDSDLFTLGREEVDRVVDAVFITTPPCSSLSRSDLDAKQIRHISELCRRNRIPVNVVDAPDLCSFSLLSVHVDGPLQIGVTTNGRGCKLAGRIRREIAAALPPGLGAAVERLGEMRRKLVVQQIKSSDEPVEVVNEGVDDSIDQPAALNKLVLEDDAEAAKTRRMRWLTQVCEYWPLRRLAEVSEEDIEAVLRSYPGSSSNSISENPNPSISSPITTTIPKPPSGGRGPSTTTPPPIGRIILAGSGPGHPDLLTRATYRAIQTADVILADKLVPAGVLDLIPRRTPVTIARKFPGNADRAQDELLAAALSAAHGGKTVLRLKQGDPFVYGRGGEEVAFFLANGVPKERVVVLPGLTSALSAPLFAGIPPTQRDVADQVLVCTGTGKKGAAPRPPEFVESRTVVFLMALHRIEGLIAELTGWTAEEQQEVGEEKKTRRLWPLTTPCAVIERASCPDQRVIRTTLRFVVEAIEQEGSRPPGLLVVGRACETLYTPEKGRSWVVEDGFRGLDLGVEVAGLGAAAGAMMGIVGMA
ncbi:hypothetical protein VTJ04DRAFT_7415 [Mycothermus thermophilus]|uniref:uncharacterized protein n=1 Tax=Humicola insolens TaxID=85995 RepID=UPI0037422348